MLFSSELVEEVDNTQIYTKIEIDELINDQKKTLNKFCKKYDKISTNGEVKDLERRWGTNWCKFNLFSGKNKIQCVTRIYNSDLINNKMYEVCGGISNGNYGLTFNIDSMNIITNELSPFEKLYFECHEKNYFLNKKNVDLTKLNNIILISKKDTQGCCDFEEHLKIPLNITVKNVTLEGENTSNDIIKAIDSINKSNEKCDLIIIMRGGGDTSAISKSFDKIELFKAIRESNIPIGTAIGHTKDVKDKLLITAISDINFDTPSVAASMITEYCKKYFYNLRDIYLKEYNDIINSRINEVDNYFSNYIENNESKLYDKLELLKEKLISNIIPVPIVELQEDNCYIYVPHGNKFKRCKVVEDGIVNVNPLDIDFIREIDNLNDFKKCLKKFNNVSFENDLILNIENILINIEKLDKNINKYENVKYVKNSYYLKSIPKYTSSNICKLKEILLYYLYSIDNINNKECKLNNFTNNDYNKLKEKIEISETVDIIDIISRLSTIINL